mmetsp:Transcript_45915/g.143839  ORF Transcript_45915/g.143839 Transcript_45915/m.143839 type:complete len:324 (+) Transcript_45915:583-1554(+)
MRVGVEVADGAVEGHLTVLLHERTELRRKAVRGHSADLRLKRVDRPCLHGLAVGECLCQLPRKVVGACLCHARLCWVCCRPDDQPHTLCEVLAHGRWEGWQPAVIALDQELDRWGVVAPWGHPALRLGHPPHDGCSDFLRPHMGHLLGQLRWRRWRPSQEVPQGLEAREGLVVFVAPLGVLCLLRLLAAADGTAHACAPVGLCHELQVHHIAMPPCTEVDPALAALLGLTEPSVALGIEGDPITFQLYLKDPARPLIAILAAAAAVLLLRTLISPGRAPAAARRRQRRRRRDQLRQRQGWAAGVPPDAAQRGLQRAWQAQQRP